MTTNTSQLGLGVMINMLCGNQSTITAIQSSLNKKIAKLILVKEGTDQYHDELRFTFDDNSTLTLWDGGQSCCEHRYMSTDDDLSDYVGATLQGFELREAPSIEDGSECHEVQFLAVKTSEGELVMVNHNQNNGYYGGFSIVARAADGEGNQYREDN